MKGWWAKKRRFSLPSNDQKSKRIKSTNTTKSTNDQDNERCITNNLKDH